MITWVINTGAPPMMTNIDTGDICCAALERSKTSWVCAFAVPGDSRVVVHKIKACDVDRLIGILNSSKAKAEHLPSVRLDALSAKLPQAWGRASFRRMKCR